MCDLYSRRKVVAWRDSHGQIQQLFRSSTFFGVDLPAHAIDYIPYSEQCLLQGVVTETIRRVKASVPAIQRKMQLYLANRETEFILFRPIRCPCQMVLCEE